ncbi:MAG: pseudouridine synthase [Candidatus Woesearchaeota archaeon]
MQERVQKILARAGIASRRKCEELIAAGRVSVNGVTIRLGDKADASVDDIRVDGSRIPRQEAKKYYVLNKPRGVVSTVSDPQNRLTVMHFVPAGARVYPVGRLDRDAEGLVLMTNDGTLANRLMHPRYKTEKTYHVTLTGEIDRQDVRRLKKGVRVGGRLVVLDKVIVHTPSHVEIALHEGRKHIVKQLFRKLGYTVARLKRTRIANIALDDLPPGACRELTRAELAGLQRLSGQSK